MEPGTPDGDAAEGPEVNVIDKATEPGDPPEGKVVEVQSAFHDPYREGAGLERIVRWKRTITIEGPVDWVKNNWVRALADGVHIMGTKRGLQCRIEVATEEWESTRGMTNATSNQAMDNLRTSNPSLYDEIHGGGASAAHAGNITSQTPTNTADSPTKPEAAHVGQYL